MIRRNYLSTLPGLALLLVASFTTTAFAQTMTQTEDFRRQAPAPLPAKPLTLPKPYETTLANGLRVVVLEDKRLPIVSYRLALRTGNANDPVELPGLNSIMAGLLNEGTATRTSKQIADEVARLGASLSAGGNADYTTVSASALSIYGDKIMDLMADIALHPSFPEDELARQKKNSKQGLVLQRSRPDFLANERLAKVIYGQNPYSVISPTPASIDAITRDKLASFHKQSFVPNNAVLVIVGDVKRDDVMNRVKTLFGSWSKGQPLAQNFPAPPARSARAIYLVDRPGSAQSNIVISNLGLTRSSADYFPAVVMNTVLGQNASSRLFMNLREKRSLTYGAYSSIDARRNAGSFRASSEVRTPVTGEALKQFFYELERIRTEPVSAKEITDAKSYLTGVFPIQLETQEGLINQLVQIKMFDLPANYLETYREHINAVTSADITRVAQTYITPDRVAIVVVGDAGKIMDQLKPYAQNIELYDAQGARKEMNSGASSGSNGMGTGTMPAGGANAMAGNSGNASNLVGSWTLQIAAPNGQTLPATLVINRNGNALGGTVKTPIAGETTLSNLTLNGKDFNAALSIEMQGQKIDAKLTGSADNNKMTGSINLAIPNAPALPFTGTRQTNP